MKKLFAFIIISSALMVQAQDEKKDFKKNSIEAYLGFCHFLDQPLNRWYILVPAPSHIVAKGRDQIMPLHIGLNYKRRLTDLTALRFSAFMYYQRYPSPIELLQIHTREYYIFSAGYQYSFVDKNKISLSALLDLNYRIGYEFFYYSIWGWEADIENIPVSDVGLTAGYKFEYKLPFNFLLFQETSYSRYIFRYSKGVDANGKIIRSSPNTLTIKLGLGYMF